MWTQENRSLYTRKGLRYPSDLTDPEWSLIVPLIPPAKRGGRKREVDVREVLNAILYVLGTGCQWRALPKDLPPRSTVHNYFTLWEWDGTLDRIHHELYVMTRELEGRDASPTAGAIGQRLWRPEAGQGHGRSVLENRGGQETQGSKGLRSSAQTLGRGTHHCLDQPLPALEQGL